MQLMQLILIKNLYFKDIIRSDHDAFLFVCFFDKWATFENFKNI